MCKKYRLNACYLHIEKDIENHYEIIDSVMQKLYEFNSCVVNLDIEAREYFKKLRKTRIYALKGHFFYYPKGAYCPAGNMHNNLRGLYRDRWKQIVLAEDCLALKWELKNLYHSCYGDKNIIDPRPNETEVGGCL